RKATFDLHRMCQEGLFELRGQRRNAYYVAGQEFVRLNSRADGEMYGADGEMYGANGEMYGADGEMYGADGEMYGADGEMYGANGEMCRVNGEMCRADGEMCRADGEMYGADELPEALKEKILKIGKRVPEEEMKKLLIELCDLHPFSLYEISILLHRNMVFLRNHYINPLMAQGKLFYTIPEMIRHPNQKYTTKKKQ
ncbi:MAG: hypothetical protein IKH44_02445, partial [Bacteroidales bacterium]|nr:hypothetical protein [Bacteroidales bacterium]